MSSRRVFVLGILGCLSFISSAFADDLASDIFTIKPYVYSINGQNLAISWEYKTRVQPAPTLELINKNARQTVLATEDQSLLTSILPIPVCDFDGFSFQVPGMPEPRAVADIPCRGQKSVGRFTFIADSQEGVGYDKIFADLITKFNGQALIVGGDLVQTGSDKEEWVKFFDAMSGVLQRQTLIPVMGNHEYRYTHEVPMWKHFFGTEATDAFYSVDVGPAHIIAINSSFNDDSTLHLKELTWIREELAKPAQWKLVVFHHPPYSASVMQNPVFPKKEYEIIRKDFVPLFEQYGVNVVLNGHTHLYEHSFKDGIHYLTTGAAGGKMGMVGAHNDFGLSLLKERTMIQAQVSSTELRLTVTSIEGKFIDEIALHPTALLPVPVIAEVANHQSRL